jgi:DNA-binding PadR family transcriptional regulator
VSPVFAHGQLRLYLLALLAEEPRHGYDVIRALEERFGGLYTPSAGTVYPRLAKLEEEGLVERSDEGRKATYRLTDAGRAEVARRQAALADLQQDLDHSVTDLAEQVRSRVRGSTSDLRAELRAAAKQARATATPAGSAHGDVELALHELRQAVRRVRTDSRRTADVVKVIDEATTRVRELLR